jgi:hypothetical protein
MVKTSFAPGKDPFRARFGPMFALAVAFRNPLNSETPSTRVLPLCTQKA